MQTIEYALQLGESNCNIFVFGEKEDNFHEERFRNIQNVPVCG